MTDKQIAQVKKKIDKYKKALAADKKYWGGQRRDGSGIRYLIPELFIKIKDYKGGLRYLTWFAKNFPDDSGYPIFLFEWTFILFKCGKLKEAQQKTHQTFFSNTYLYDTFLGKEHQESHKEELSSWEISSLTKHLNYRKTDDEFIEFSKWVEDILNSRAFLDKANEFIEIKQKLKDEPDGPRRSKLVERSFEIKCG